MDQQNRGRQVADDVRLRTGDGYCRRRRGDLVQEGMVMEPKSITVAGAQTLVIEYIDGLPHAVSTEKSAFDFDWCKRDDALLYQNVGTGCGGSHILYPFAKPSPPPGKVWTALGITLCRWESSDRSAVPIDDDELLAMGYIRLRKPLLLTMAGVKTMDPFEAGEESEGRLEYCSVCDDRLPDDSLCDHLYRPDCSEVVGAGGEKPSEESMFAALDWLTTVPKEIWSVWCCWCRNDPPETNLIKLIERRLRSGSFRRAKEPSHALEDLVSDKELWLIVEDGLGWLTTLGRDTPEANAQTLKWLRIWRRTAKKRAEASERKRLIADLVKHPKAVEDSAAALAALGIPDGKRKDLESVPTERLRSVLVALEATGEQRDSSH